MPHDVIVCLRDAPTWKRKTAVRLRGEHLVSVTPVARERSDETLPQRVTILRPSAVNPSHVIVACDGTTTVQNPLVGGQRARSSRSFAMSVLTLRGIVTSSTERSLELSPLLLSSANSSTNMATMFPLMSGLEYLTTKYPHGETRPRTVVPFNGHGGMKVARIVRTDLHCSSRPRAAGTNSPCFPASPDEQPGCSSLVHHSWLKLTRANNQDI